MIRSLSFLALVAVSLLPAGQSLTQGNVTNPSFPNRAKNLPYRVEMYIHDWTTPAQNARPFAAPGVGFDSYFTDGTLLVVYSLWDTGGVTFNFRLSDFPSRRLYIRFQRDPSLRVHHCEAWDETGTRRFVSSQPYTATQQNMNNSGASSSASGYSVAFARVHSSLVPLNSRPPVAADLADRLLDWRFSNSLADSSGAGHHGSGPGVVYGPTPDIRAFSRIKANATTWSNWTSLRAGVPQVLDGGDSYSQSDAGSGVQHAWQQISGPSNVRFSNTTVGQPTVTGLVFGSYVFRLEVVDTEGRRSASTLEVGAVATDDNGVVIHADPNVEKIFGPMIAFGRNPWGFADDAHLRGAVIRSGFYDTITPPEWTQHLPGSVTYQATSNAAAATLASAIDFTSSSFTVTSTSNLDLANLPTILGFGFPGYGGEEVLVCSVSGNVLQVCFDGRGYNNTTPRSYVQGQAIYQRRVRGTGTNFLATFCPAGPGLEGPVRYATGQVTVSPGSTMVTGLNTEWTSANGVFPFLTIRIEGTHGGGQPFVFFSNLQSIGGAQSMVMTRPWPNGADPGTLSYKLIQRGVNNFAPGWIRPDGSTGQAFYGTTACLSNTDLYWNGGFEVVTGQQTGQFYGAMSRFWMSAGGNGTPNFYDEVLANYALYFRSGWRPALEAARKLGDHWLKQPLLDEGWLENAPRNISAAGVVAAAVLDGRTQNWYALRRLAQNGVNATAKSCDDDVRENAYQQMWLAFAAMFDPLDTGNPNQPGQRSYWKAKLQQGYARDASCKRNDDSFSSGFYFNASGPAMNVTNGSTQVTGTGFQASFCPRTGGGTGTISANSDQLMADSNVPPGQASIVITGTRGGQPYSTKLQYQGNGRGITLSALWPGDAGPVRWQTESDTWITSISPTDPNSPEFGKPYACTFVSPSQLTLDRPWEGPSGTVRLYRGNLVGRGQQPFIAGIKVLQMKYASLASSGQLSQDYLGLTSALAAWIRDFGYDPVTGGLHYGRLFPMCEPLLTASRPGFTFRNTECNYGLGRDEKGTARALLAEAQSAIRVFYETEPNLANRELGDRFYANQWGMPGSTDPSVPLAEGLLPNIYASDSALGFGKWYGFQFGVGMAHQWPAVRLGGVAPAAVENLRIDFAQESIPGTATIVLRLTRPTGEISDFVCEPDHCMVEMDRRTGQHWYQLRWVDAEGKTLSQGEPELVGLR